MAPKFGTSGLRGLVVELTKHLVQDHVLAFLESCPHGGCVYVGEDLRASSPEIGLWVREIVREQGIRAVDCGAVPTPALALASLQANAAAVMVTGSHIPADRNGLKFYVPTGEISKSDEERILAALGSKSKGEQRPAESKEDVGAPYAARYVQAYGGSLTGLTIGVYQHSSVARDLMCTIFEALGAKVVPIARSEVFVPVDTEALDPATKALFSGWFEEHSLDVLVSTDGDADRPMVVDDAQRVVPGDVLGAVTARALGAKIVCTPVSSNTMISDAQFGFDQIDRTRIGSPYVIAAMEAVLADDPQAAVVGYEANGGFLLGFHAAGPTGSIAPLMTRDCLLPMIAPLAAAQAACTSLSALVDALPPCFTAADRLQGIESDASKAFLSELSSSSEARAEFFTGYGTEIDLDETDGLRVRFDTAATVHLRPSGNAPEFRCYAEADSRPRAEALVSKTLEMVRQKLG